MSRALSCSGKNRAGYPPGQSVAFQFFFSTGLSQARVKLLQELSVPLLMIAQQVPVDVFKVKNAQCFGQKLYQDLLKGDAKRGQVIKQKYISSVKSPPISPFPIQDICPTEI